MMTDKVESFRALHRPGQPLILVNVWDAASARIVAATGAPAIATTSAGVAWSLGAPDGDALGRDAALDLIRRVVSAVDVPVSADIESGFGDDPEAVRETGVLVRAAGAVGVNVEDGTHSVADAAARFASLRGLGLFVNARIDTFLRGSGDLTETLRRAEAYLEAGADGIFVPGVLDPDVVGALARGIEAPVNVLVGAGAPPVKVLADLGVARISLGSSVAEAAYGLVRRTAAEAYGQGTYQAVDGGFSYPELNALMAAR